MREIIFRESRTWGDIFRKRQCSLNGLPWLFFMNINTPILGQHE